MYMVTGERFEVALTDVNNFSEGHIMLFEGCMLGISCRMGRLAVLRTMLVVSFILHVWAQGCKKYEKRCLSGLCVNFGLDCPEAKTHCPDGLKLCDDGKCILLSMKCGDEEDDDDDCHKRCRNEQCIDINAFCLEDLCPYWKKNKCDDGDCFTDDEWCNGVPYCQDESDEKDCKDQPTDILKMITKWPWWVYAIAVGLFILLCLIIALCCRYQNKQARVRRMRRETRVRRMQQGNNPYQYSHEMPVVAGRRTQPVLTGGSPSAGGSTPASQSYQPLPTQPPPTPAANESHLSAPSPYNPTLNQQSPFSQSSAHYGVGGDWGLQGTPGNVEPSAPPLGMEAPPPYSEAVGESFHPGQLGKPNQPYLPSYETVQRGGP